MRITSLTLAILLATASFAWCEEKDDPRKALGADQDEMKKLLGRFDLNGDGQVDPAEQAKAADAMKRQFDRNRNGRLDPEEAALAQRMMSGYRKGGPPQFGAGGAGGAGGGFGGGAGGAGGGFDGFNGGGRGGAGGGSAFGGPIPPDVLKKFDKNKDGQLDEKEQKAAAEALGPKKSRKEKLQEKLDLNGDGKISKDEREHVAAQQKAEQEEKKAEQASKKGKPKKDEDKDADETKEKDADEKDDKKDKDADEKKDKEKDADEKK